MSKNKKIVNLLDYKKARVKRKKRIEDVNDLVRQGVITPAEAMDYLDSFSIDDVSIFSGSEVWDDPE